MQQIIGKLLCRYGETLVLEGQAGTLTFQGVFQHTGSKDWHNMEKTYSLLGQMPRGQYLVLAPVGVALQAGDRLLVGSRRFGIRRAESVKWKAKPAYTWGLCVELGGEDTWPV